MSRGRAFGLNKDYLVHQLQTNRDVSMLLGLPAQILTIDEPVWALSFKEAFTHINPDPTVEMTLQDFQGFASTLIRSGAPVVNPPLTGRA